MAQRYVCRRRGIASARVDGMRHSNATILRQTLLRLALGVFLFVSTAFAENVLSIERVSPDKCQAVLVLTEPAGGIQFTIVGSAGVVINSLENGRSAAGNEWIVGWNPISDGEVRVVIMGRAAGALPAGRYELLTWSVASEEERAMLEYSDVVLADDDGNGLSVSSRGLEWSLGRSAFTLLGNYPNPFNPSTVISFELQRRAEVSLEVYDVVGRRVDVIIDGVRDGGTHQVSWTTQGRRLATGVYMIRLTVDGRSAVCKMNVIQ